MTACVPTRDRGASIALTLRSLRDLEHDSFEVIVVDQSADDLCRKTYRDMVGHDPRFSFISSESVGRSVACNLGLSHARGGIIAFTDDDCEVPPDWLSGIESALARQPNAAMICGAVRAAPHDHERYFTLEFKFVQPRIHRSPWLAFRAKGAGGANLAFLTPVLRAVGGFDEVLGVGSPLRASEDFDILYRVLRAGYAVLELPEPAVVHHGLKPWETEGRQRLWNYAMSHGAAWMKHLRLGDPAVFPEPLLGWPVGSLQWGNLVRLRRPTGLYLVVALFRGAVASFHFRIDRTSRTYVPRHSGRTSDVVSRATRPAASRAEAGGRLSAGQTGSSSGPAG